MAELRALIRRHRLLVIAFAILSLCVKAALPAGFMPVASPDRMVVIAICSAGTGIAQAVELAVPMKDSGEAEDGGAAPHCAFAGLAKMGLDGADALPVLLALLFALLLGFAPLPRPVLRRGAKLRPPLRGPPTRA